MADSEHLAGIKGGVAVWNEWRENNPASLTSGFAKAVSGVNLREADLRKADLREANLSWADLSGPCLEGADLTGADLSKAYLRWADLAAANIRNALDYLPRKADDDCLQELRWIYDRREAQEARQDLAAWLLKWGKRYAKLCAWVEENIEETVSFYRLQQHHKNLK